MKALILTVLSLFAMAPFAQSIEIKGPHQSKKYDLKDLKRKLKVQAVRIDDPVYKKTMTFDGFALSDVLAMAGLKPDDRADELVFTAVDGYSPNMSFAKLKERKGYLVFQEHGRKGTFSLVDQGKAKISPGPFYVVWSAGGADVPWPYQLASIEAVDWAVKYPRVVPPKVAEDSAEMKGFTLFKNECIRCHSINLQGGDLGPELNAPQNITEYWRSDVLRDFIHNAASFRFKSKMPSFASLKSEDLDQLIAYLSHMRAYKIQSDTP